MWPLVSPHLLTAIILRTANLLHVEEVPLIIATTLLTVGRPRVVDRALITVITLLTETRPLVVDQVRITVTIRRTVERPRVADRVRITATTLPTGTRPRVVGRVLITAITQHTVRQQHAVEVIPIIAITRRTLTLLPVEAEDTISNQKWMHPQNRLQLFCPDHNSRFNRKIKMKVITSIHPEYLEHLEVFRKWAFNPKIQSDIQSKFRWPKNIFFKEGRPETATSAELLNSINAPEHIGFPIDMYGLDFNYSNLKKSAEIVDEDFFNEIRRMNLEIDDRFQTLLGAYHPALKAYYPKNGYIAWHTNWNAPGYNIIFSFSNGGDGYWRHVDPKTEKVVQINDVPGWHCKAGYFGSREEKEHIMWHSAYTNEPRLTLSYVFKDKTLWEDLVEEISEC